MNNKLFINRCETILVTMKAKNCQSVRTPEVAKWLEMTDANAINVMAKMCKLNIFKKIGAAQLTRYELSDNCNNSLIAAINQHNDVIKAVSAVVKWYVDHKSNPTPQQEISPSQRKIDPKRKQAIDFLMAILDDNEAEVELLRRQNEDLQAEVELLREENAKLHEIEKKYNKITELVRIK